MGGLDPDDRAQGLADMLSTWETPLDGLRDASRVEELTALFEEPRLQAVEGLAAAQIAGTRAGDAVKTLEALVREYPTRENLWFELARGAGSDLRGLQERVRALRNGLEGGGQRRRRRRWDRCRVGARGNGGLPANTTISVRVAIASG
jgi:hypothetical protein